MPRSPPPGPSNDSFDEFHDTRESSSDDDPSQSTSPSFIDRATDSGTRFTQHSRRSSPHVHMVDEIQPGHIRSSATVPAQIHRTHSPHVRIVEEEGRPRSRLGHNPNFSRSAYSHGRSETHGNFPHNPSHAMHSFPGSAFSLPGGVFPEPSISLRTPTMTTLGTEGMQIWRRGDGGWRDQFGPLPGAPGTGPMGNNGMPMTFFSLGNRAMKMNGEECLWSKYDPHTAHAVGLMRPPEFNRQFIAGMKRDEDFEATIFSTCEEDKPQIHTEPSESRDISPHNSDAMNSTDDVNEDKTDESTAKSSPRESMVGLRLETPRPGGRPYTDKEVRQIRDKRRQLRFRSAREERYWTKTKRLDNEIVLLVRKIGRLTYHKVKRLLARICRFAGKAGHHLSTAAQRVLARLASPTKRGNTVTSSKPESRVRRFAGRAGQFFHNTVKKVGGRNSPIPLMPC